MTERDYKTGREKYAMLPSGSISLTGTADSAARWIEREQLTDASLWAGFVNEYRVRTDDGDNGLPVHTGQGALPGAVSHRPRHDEHTGEKRQDIDL